VETVWIFGKIWNQNQKDDIHNFLYGYKGFYHSVNRGWLVSLTKFNLSVKDVRSTNNAALRIAVEEGHLEVVRWLVETFNLTPHDVRIRNNEALQLAAYGGHLKIVKYLIETFKLTVKDVRSNNNLALRIAKNGSHLDVVRYLVEKFNLTVND
jgi:ankyrin repeat protein